jgi:hypothetical protein
MTALELAARACMVDRGQVARSDIARIPLPTPPPARPAWPGLGSGLGNLDLETLTARQVGRTLEDKRSMQTTVFEPGGYRFIPAVFQYSGGVGALPGYRMVRVRFKAPVPLAEGFRRAEAIMNAAGRPPTAFAACELRSPAPFTEDGFREFNRHYAGTLQRWGVYDGGAINPVARSNVCPEIAPPPEPSFHAFTYTEPAADAAPSFVVAGSGESQEGNASYSERTIRLGDVSPDGIRAKGVYVLGEMERRLAALGFTWHDTTATQLYTVHNVHPFLADEIVGRGAAAAGLTWHYCRPPVVNLEYEMDCRGTALELVV